ncbi:hypothetical protein [Parashewanella tropica]|uniref:hypothetical protein n=1 Tax=Parashewanella tropica TaxID=2547970 RepID=UPI001059AC7B|nr:hypothetical protein [Parashewanella tropica]
MITLLSVLLLVLGVVAIREHTSFTSSSKRRLLGLALLVLSMLCCMASYGILRGIFVWLGLLSLIGFIVTYYTKKPS